MTRYTDALFFGFLFVLDVIAWLIVWASGGLPEVAADQLAPLTVAVMVVIAAPAFAAIAILSLARGLSHTSPRLFWTWVVGGSLLVTGCMALSLAVTKQMGLELGFSTALWFMVIVSVCAIIALFLSMIGAIVWHKPQTPVSPVDEAPQTGVEDVEEPITEELPMGAPSEDVPTFDSIAEDTN